MNKDEAREAAVNETARLMVRDSTRGSRKQILEALYDAGAASVDRRAIVREAFKKVMRQAKKGGHLVIQLSVLAKQMDAVLAEMEANNENS